MNDNFFVSKYHIFLWLIKLKAVEKAKKSEWKMKEK